MPAFWRVVVGRIAKHLLSTGVRAEGVDRPEHETIVDCTHFSIACDRIFWTGAYGLWRVDPDTEGNAQTRK